MVDMQPDSPAISGLTTSEVLARDRRGETNSAVNGSSRSYRTILRTNVFSFYNSILFVIGLILLALTQYSDALITVGLGLINAMIGATQEIRAKRKLDHLQLLEQALVLVVRDGGEVEVPPTAVVRGDVLRVRRGDQIVVDGPLLDGDGVEADESLLTGESDPVLRGPGDDLRSGSLCVAGGGHQLARDVGAASYAGRLTADARRTTTDQTPLQRQIGFVIRLVMVLVGLMSVTILAQCAIEGFSLLRTVQITAVLSGLVPYGLFFLIAVAYTAGATRIAGRGALVQQVNAVESISNVDVICTDKTGTLTTGALQLEDGEALGELTAEAVTVILGGLAHSAGTPNLTTTALVAALPAAGWTVQDEVPFTSARRWSGVTTDQGSWVLGAPDVLAPFLTRQLPAEAVSERAHRGLRVLVLAEIAHPTGSLRDSGGRARLLELEPLAVVAFSDQLRPDVAGAIVRFRDAGVTIKVLSGDDPRTVAAMARQAGLPAEDPVAGSELEGIDDEALDRIVGRTDVFGRVTPEQKERIVGSLRRQGRYVAMVGDGINDARALKGAQVGVAMRSGSSVTRDIADIVLLDDSLSALLPAQSEGRRIINGIATSMYVYLARVATQGLVILAVTMLGLGFPYSPTQVGLTLLTVGVPTLFLASWANSSTPEGNLLANLARFVIPAAVVTAAFGTAVYARLYELISHGVQAGDGTVQVINEFESYTGLKYADADFRVAAATIGAQTALSTFICFASFILILFLVPPSRLFAAWTRPTGDRRPAVLVVVLVVVFFGVLFIPPLSDWFGLIGTVPPIWNTVVPALVLWFLTLTVVFRLRLMDRVLGGYRAPGLPARAIIRDGSGAAGATDGRGRGTDIGGSPSRGGADGA